MKNLALRNDDRDLPCRGDSLLVSSIKNATAATHTDYGNNQDHVPNMRFLSFWNGAYTAGGGSNLMYCKKGTFGDMATKNSADYLPVVRKTYTVTPTAANTVYTLATVPADAGEYYAKLLVHITSTTNTDVNQISVVELHGGMSGKVTTVPTITNFNRMYSTAAANIGISYYSVEYQKTVGNGYKMLIDITVPVAAQRTVSVEMLDGRNVTLVNSLAATAYNAAYQARLTVDARGNYMYKNDWIGGSINGTSASAYGLRASQNAAGEAAAAGDVILLDRATLKWYKSTTARTYADGVALVGVATAAYASGAVVNAWLGANYYNCTAVTVDGQAANKTVYARGKHTGDQFVTDGTVTSALAAGYDYILLGTLRTATSIYLQPGAPELVRMTVYELRRDSGGFYIET